MFSLTFFQDIPWSHQESLQIEGRVCRYGQTRAVEIYKIIAQDTVDEDLLQLSGAKGAALEMFNLYNDLDEEPPELPDINQLDVPFSPKKKKTSAKPTKEEQDLAQEREFQRKKEQIIAILKEWRTAQNRPPLQISDPSNNSSPAVEDTTDGRAIEQATGFNHIDEGGFKAFEAPVSFSEDRPDDLQPPMAQMWVLQL